MDIGLQPPPAVVPAHPGQPMTLAGGIRAGTHVAPTDGASVVGQEPLTRFGPRVLAKLLHVSGVLASELELERVYTCVLEVVQEITGATRVSLQLLEPLARTPGAAIDDQRHDDESPVAGEQTPEQYLCLVAGLGLPPEVNPGWLFPVGESISGWVLRHRTPLLVIGDEHPDPEVDALLRRGRRRRDTEAELESALCIPLEVQGRVLGVLNATKRHTTERFDEADLAVAVELARRVALAIDHARLYRDAQQQAQLQTALNDALRQTERLQRFFAPQIAELFADQEDKLHTHRRELTILFSDIRGFTSLSENLEPEELVALLNEYFSAMTEVVYEYGGTLDKYLGDGILAFFGDPVPQPDHAVRAVRAALAMQRRLAALQDHWFAAGYARLAMGIGINTGWVTVGTVGSRWRQEYTIIGDNVNVASRLTGVAGPGEIVLSEKTWRLVREHIGVVPRGAVRLKGKRQLMPIFVATDAGVEAEAL